MRFAAALFATLALGAAPTAQAQTMPASQAAPDYANPSAWVCRPGKEDACTRDLDAMAVQVDGARSLQPFHAAADAPIDCFYVYPTVSKEPGDYADMAATPEVVRRVHDQAGRLTQACRLYAPIYRQLTSAGLERAMAGPDPAAHLNFDGPYADVRAAWRWYLDHENKGRGVVLVGHSQGTIVLQRLIKDEIDAKPVQARLVSAFLAGDPSLPVPKGARVGGVFKSVPLCAAAFETGCVYVWGDYLEGDAAQPKPFGAEPGHGLAAGCADPAAPSGGTGLLKAYLKKPAMAPADDPPLVEAVGQLAVACRDDGRNNVARIAVVPEGKYAALLRDTLSLDHGGWGLHPLDIALTQGNILDRIADETAAWAAAGAGRRSGFPRR